MTLASLAQDQLDMVTVTISEPSGFPGSVWNIDEYAFVTVEVQNSSDVLLRDVVMDFHSGNASIAPFSIFGILLFDGEEYWSELEAGQTAQYVVRLKANWAGNAHMWVGMSAEVVPYASNWHVTHRDANITAL